MKTLRSLPVAVALLAALATLPLRPALSAEQAVGTPRTPNAGFDLMKSLVGDWVSPSKEGKPTTVSYKLVSDGTALMEMTAEHGSPMAMVTLYHADGEGLLMTHYCSANNQPRMRCAKPAAGAKSLSFEFLDCSNLPTPATGHMHQLVITFEDADHISQAWTWQEGGKSETQTFHLERQKS